MNIVVSLFAHENDEKQVIRFKKIPDDSEASKFFATDKIAFVVINLRLLTNFNTSKFIECLHSKSFQKQTLSVIYFVASPNSERYQ